MVLEQMSLHLRPRKGRAPRSPPAPQPVAWQGAEGRLKPKRLPWFRLQWSARSSPARSGVQGAWAPRAARACTPVTPLLPAFVTGTWSSTPRAPATLCFPEAKHTCAGDAALLRLHRGRRDPAGEGEGPDSILGRALKAQRRGAGAPPPSRPCARSSCRRPEEEGDQELGPDHTARTEAAQARGFRQLPTQTQSGKLRRGGDRSPSPCAAHRFTGWDPSVSPCLRLRGGGRPLPSHIRETDHPADPPTGAGPSGMRAPGLPHGARGRHHSSIPLRPRFRRHLPLSKPQTAGGAGGASLRPCFCAGLTNVY